MKKCAIGAYLQDKGERRGDGEGSWTNELVCRLGILVCASDVQWHRSAEAWRPPLRFEAAFSGANVRAGERFSKLTINLINECRSWLV